jgi:hypothetical protein
MTERYEGPLIAKLDGGDTFEVWRDTQAGDSFRYVGFFNGERSVEATDPNIAFRGMWRKHRIGLPDGKLIDFLDEARKRRRP